MMIEVYIETNEPWTNGQRIAFARAVLKYAENPEMDYATDPQFDADAVLTTAPGYLGWGANVHEDADGPVFDNPEAASRFASYVREEVAGLGMTVRQFSL